MTRRAGKPRRRPATAGDPLTLEGRVAVVTGAGNGIGAETASLMARKRARIGLIDRDGAALASIAERIALAGGEALFFETDVTDAFAVERAIDRVAQEWGRLDILVNNAGIARDATLLDVAEPDWTETLDVNLRGCLFCTRAAVPHMLANGYGRILSAASIVARDGNYGQTSYAASKAGIIGMTRTWARELGPKGITANAVAPGFIDTAMIRGIPDKVRRRVLSRLPVGRLGRPDEVAGVYLFLASELASYVNGAVVGVDGGLRL